MGNASFYLDSISLASSHISLFWDGSSEIFANYFASSITPARPALYLPSGVASLLITIFLTETSTEGRQNSASSASRTNTLLEQPRVFQLIRPFRTFSCDCLPPLPPRPVEMIQILSIVLKTLNTNHLSYIVLARCFLFPFSLSPF